MSQPLPLFKPAFLPWKIQSGYKKIRDGFKAVGLPMPTVKSEFGGTTVTFQRGYDVVKGQKNVTSGVTSDVVSNVVSDGGSGGSFGGS